MPAGVLMLAFAPWWAPDLPAGLMVPDGIRSHLSLAANTDGQFGAADNVPRDVARSIAACWHAPHEGDEITLRMSFRRDGSIFGKPRITYMEAANGADGRAALANSIFAALAACSPLRFTPSLGAAIAGRIFLIRFVAPHREQRAEFSSKGA